MSKDHITTTTIKNDSKEGVDSSGTVNATTGYTANENLPKDNLGHYVFDEPQEIDPLDNKCYAKKIAIKNPNENGFRYKHYIKVGPDGRLFNPWGMYSEGTQS